MMLRRRRFLQITALVGALGLTAVAAPAFAAFPYTRPGGNPHNFTDL
jgi:hypothetical protein